MDITYLCDTTYRKAGIYHIDMNYLAHAYLSFGDPAILAGNMLSDFIKGKKQFDYSEHIQKGIQLHRAIDQFTDAHPATATIKGFFKPAYKLYASPFSDIVYDHFLANDKNIFPGDELAVFAEATYRQLKEYEEVFPPVFHTIYYYMQLHNWLYNYRLTEGIFRSFEGLVRRAKYMNDATPAKEIFLNNYDALQECYESFFPEVRAFAYSTMRNLA